MFPAEASEVPMSKPTNTNSTTRGSNLSSACDFSNTWIASLQLVLLEELPHKIVGRDVLDRLTDEAHGRLLARPCVTSFFDDDQHDLGPILAAAIGLACHFHLVPVLGKRFDLRLPVTA